MSKFRVYFKSGWRWLLIDDNGEPVAQSEPYAGGKDAAIQGARNVKATAPFASIVVVE